MTTTFSTHDLRGWEILRLTSPEVEVDVVPGKGGDVLAVTWRALEVNVLWTTPWGLRAKGAVGTGADAYTAFIEAYPGGWQTIFPNGGNPVTEQGVESGFHGEACLVPWDYELTNDGDGARVDLTTRLTRSPFALRKELRLDGAMLTVRETVTNCAGNEQEAMWSHHPAFGEPFLAANCVVDCGAREFRADDGTDTPGGDLAPGAISAWPKASGRDGTDIDLRSIPPRGVDRLGYLLDFDRGWYSITNPSLPLTATLRWDTDVFDKAWYWFEGNCSTAFPWYQQAYVFAIEPAASYPGHGIATARATTGSVLRFAPGQSRTVTLNLELSPDPKEAGR